MPPISQPPTKSSRNFYLFQFLDLLHAYIDDIVDVDNDGTYGVHAITA